MKVRALASISGGSGDRAVGDEFVVGAALAQELIGRRLVEEVAAEPEAEESVPPAKPAKAESAAKE